jgi:hypothetical protein
MARMPNDPSAPKQKRTRAASAPKPAYFIVQILDENMQPMPFSKERIKILGVERNAEKVLEITEGGVYPHAVYLRGVVPSNRGKEGTTTPTLGVAA